MAVKKESQDVVAEEKKVQETVQEPVNTGREAKVKEKVISQIYIGPTLPGGLLNANRILVGTPGKIRAELKEALEKYPLVEKLIFPLEQLAEKKNKVNVSGNILNKYYTDILSCIVGKE